MLALQPAAAYANRGPLTYPARGQGLLQFDERSNISLVREKVSFSIGQPGRAKDEADISVRYELTSSNANRQNVEMLFLTPASGQNLTVTEGNKQLEGVTAAEAFPLNWSPQRKDTVTEPVSGKTLKLFRGINYSTLLFDAGAVLAGGAAC